MQLKNVIESRNMAVTSTNVRQC